MNKGAASHDLRRAQQERFQPPVLADGPLEVPTELGSSSLNSLLDMSPRDQREEVAFEVAAEHMVRIAPWFIPSNE